VLRLLQDQLQALYQVEAPDLADFLVDRPTLEQVLPEARPSDEWVLVRQHEEGIDIAVWIDEAHLQSLERHPRPAELVEADLRAWCAAIEGLSHFLLLWNRAQQEQPLSLLELEVQAEVDKFASAQLHHPRRARELHHRIFEGAQLQEGLGAAEVERYREAGRLAAPFCRRLSTLPHAAAQIEALRRFWRQPGSRRLAELRRAA
jgi:hypothetical protein